MTAPYTGLNPQWRGASLNLDWEGGHLLDERNRRTLSLPPRLLTEGSLKPYIITEPPVKTVMPFRDRV